MDEIIATLSSSCIIDKKRVNDIKDVLFYKNYTIKTEFQYTFDNGAITWGLVLAESHFILHTYPEYKTILINLLTCRSDKEEEEEIFNRIVSILDAKIISKETIKRITNASI